MRIMLKSKIHRARVTQLNIDYEGSITIDRKLMEAAEILPCEQVHIVNINNGARFVTYAIEGEAGSGVIGLNGAAARLAAKGDVIIILTYAYVNDEEARHLQPRVVHVNARNAVVDTTSSIEALNF
ncbi:MAG: aspartate 1-decarboxylase [Chloroflexota bacterium]